MDPKDVLNQGCEILDAVLLPKGFQFHLRGEGPSSGGQSAFGEYVRDDRRLELHFRYSLGMVRYHSASHNVSHENYMRELGALQKCRYPGFSSDSIDAFCDLAHDLQFADDFLLGDASLLKAAAIREVGSTQEQEERLMVGYVGDTRVIEQMRVLFKQQRYADVVSQFAQLKYPGRLKPSDLRMIEIARKS